MAQPKPSPAALALAREKRAFDARLSDAELVTIAHAIDETHALGAALAPAKKSLTNADEPLVAVRLAVEPA